MQVECNEGIARELYEDFSFTTKGYQFGKRKGWDGKIHLFKLRGNRMYMGLAEMVCDWAEFKHYSVKTEDWEVTYTNPDNTFLGDLYTHVYAVANIKVREDQDYLISSAIQCGRATLISPTGSGKSLIAYCIARYFLEKTLIIVPTINLVNQMYNDFKDYGIVEQNMHRIYAYDGMVPETIKPITISTWQSLMDLPPEFFQDFKVVIGDEAHVFKAKSLVSIMEKLTNAPYRFAMTATLANKDAQVNEMVIEGLFGPVVKGLTTQQLMEEGHLATLNIYCIILQYPEAIRKKLRKATHVEETDFLVAYAPRQEYIKKMAVSLQGSTFVLFRLVEKHGLGLFDDIKKIKGGKAHLVYGETEAEIREAIRLTANEDEDAVVVASYGVFSGGVNVPNLRNGIFASPYKSQIKVLQSIGRTLRRTVTKPKATIYDIVDDLSIGEHQNYGIKHYLERLKLYYHEFPNIQIKIVTVQL